jgi:hypothetical protein
MRHVSDRGLFDDTEVDQMMNAVALLAVHAGIALCDAVLMMATGERSRAQNHAEAPINLSKWCGKHQIDQRGVKHLVWLVAHKDHFAYGDSRVTLDEAKSAVDRIERFTAWVLESFPELSPQPDDPET